MHTKKQIISIRDVINDSDLLEKCIRNNVIYIKNIFDQIKLHADHPFRQTGIEDSAELRQLAFLLLLLPNDILLERFIDSLSNQTNFEIYHQSWSEIQLLYHITISLLKCNSLFTDVKFDNKVSSKNNKDVDFSFKINANINNINIEVKRITCDPIEKEDNLSSRLYIKKLFKDIKLEELIDPSELSKYSILEASTHYQTLKDEIKKINDKYHYTEDRENALNIGVINIDFATSFEEFISYLANSKKGLLVEDARIFKNIDAISLTFNNPVPQYYEPLNAYTFVTNKSLSECELQILEKIGLGRVIYNNKIVDDFKEYAEELYITLKLFCSNGIINFYRTDIPDTEIEKYHESLSKVDLHPCVKF